MHAYIVLLLVGFAMHLLSLVNRWALTPPFHPYSFRTSGIFSVALSLRLPSLDVIQHHDFIKPGLSSVEIQQQLSKHLQFWSVTYSINIFKLILCDISYEYVICCISFFKLYINNIMNVYYVPRHAKPTYLI